MSESIKALIFAIMGAAVVFTGIATDAGWEILTLGVAITLFSTICIIFNNRKNKK